MPVEKFVEGIEPQDPAAPIWRFVELWKLDDLVRTGELYFRRADKLNDEHEGLPPAAYEQVLGLNPYDINDIRERNNDIGAIAQFRQAFYVNCWYLFDDETARMWAGYGKDGVAIVSRYDRLKNVLEPLADKPHLGLVRYGLTHIKRWNTVVFATTKREEFRHEREVRALLWLTNSGDGVNRHIDIDNRIHDRPIYDPPETLPEGIRRPIDVATLIGGVVVSPMAPKSRLTEVERLLTSAGLSVPVQISALTRYASFIPSEDELRRFLSRRA